MDQPPADSVQLKIQKTSDCGFLWAFELIHSKASKGKIALHHLETNLKLFFDKSRRQEHNNSNLQENQFVAAYIENWRRYIRSYITHITQDSKGGTYQVFLIDYGFHETVNARDIRKLPDFASVHQLRAQAWKIAIYGVLPLHIEFNFGEPSQRRAGKQWNAKDIHFIRQTVKTNDIYFVQVEKFEEYRFGMIYIKDQATQKYYTLQELLIKNNNAVKFENFTRLMPSVVRRFEQSADNVSFPFGEDENDPRSSLSVSDAQSDNESSVSLETYETDQENEQSISSLDDDRNEPVQVRTPVQSSTSSSASIDSRSTPKQGKSRGEVMASLSRSLNRKKMADSPPKMIGRTPEIEREQFDDSPNDSPRQTPKQRPITYDLTTPSPEQPNTRDSSTEDSRSKHFGSFRKTPKPNEKVIDLTTPSPEKVNTGAGRGILMQKLMASRSSPSTSRSSDDVHSFPNSPRRHGNDLSSDIVPLSPHSNTIVDIPSKIRAPKFTSISSMESLPEVQMLSSMRNKSQEVILISSTESSPHEPVSVSKTTPKSSVESLPREEVPTDAQEIACKSRLNEEISAERLLLDKILVIGDVKFHPRFHLKDHDINVEIRERLQQLRIQDLIRCQQYMIPAMLTRRNITLIDGPKSGKTLSCMIALLSAVKEKNFYKKLANGPGPRAIVLCPYASRCEWIYQQCHEITKLKSNSLTQEDYLKINVAYGSGKELEKEKLDELVKGYDVVICTPPCLLRLLEIPEMFNLKRLCHLVLDEAHILLDSYNEETVEIMRRAYEVGKKTESGLILPQRVIISNSWLPKIRQMVKDDVTKGLGAALFSSYLEAAIFCNMKASLKYLDDSDRKLNDILECLDHDAALKSVVIVFDDSQDFYEIFTRLKSSCARPLYMLSRIHQLFDEEVADWKADCINGRCPVLLCNDFVLPDLRINEAEFLIHYGLPDKKSTFARRFSLILNSLNVPREYLQEGVKSQTSLQAETKIYLNRDNYEQFPTIVNLMERLHASIPREVKNITNKLKNLREQRKGNVQFCENLKKFARCENETLCEDRHSFFLDYDQADVDIPHEGLVKVHIVHVFSASHFSVRLLEHKSGSDKWTRITSISHPLVVKNKVNRYFSVAENRAPPVTSSVGDVVAIETAPHTYERVKIMKLVENEKLKTKRTAIVKFLEEGKIMDVRESVLLKLSDELAKIPPTTVDVFVCNLLPVDRDIEWGDIITYKVKQKIEQMQEEHQKFFIGKIKLVAGRDIWLDPFECKQWCTAITEYITVFSIFRHLLREKMAVVNDEHLSKLQKMYEWAGFTLPEEAFKTESNIPLSPPAPKRTSLPKPTPNESPKPKPVAPVVTPKSEVEPKKESHDLQSQMLKQILHVSSVENEESEEEYHSVSSQSGRSKDASSSQNSSQSDLELLGKKFDELVLAPPTEETFDVSFTDEELKMMIRNIMPGVLPDSESDKESDDKSDKESDDKSDEKSDEESPAPTKMILKPKLEWHQDVASVYITIFLNIDEYTVRFSTRGVYFRADFDNKTYEFDEPLFASIDEDQSTHRKSGVTIALKIEKLVKRNKWSRLLKRKDMQHWVKVNQDHLDDDDVHIPDEYFPEKLFQPPAFILDKEAKFKPFEKNNLFIPPEGYEEEAYSSSDSDAYGDRMEEYCDQ